MNTKEKLSLEIDDHEKLKGRYLRTSKRYVELLKEGIHAGEAGKLHVTKDHMERVLEGLLNDVKFLEGR